MVTTSTPAAAAIRFQPLSAVQAGKFFCLASARQKRSPGVCSRSPQLAGQPREVLVCWNQLDRKRIEHCVDVVLIHARVDEVTHDLSIIEHAHVRIGDRLSDFFQSLPAVRFSMGEESAD